MAVVCRHAQMDIATGRHTVQMMTQLRMAPAGGSVTRPPPGSGPFGSVLPMPARSAAWTATDASVALTTRALTQYSFLVCVHVGHPRHPVRDGPAEAGWTVTGRRDRWQRCAHPADRAISEATVLQQPIIQDQRPGYRQIQGKPGRNAHHVVAPSQHAGG